MKLQLVSLELAKKLKEVGFNEPCNKAYRVKGDNVSVYEHTAKKLNGQFKKVVSTCSRTNSEFKLEKFSAPTLELAKMWFREVHKMEIHTEHSHITGKWLHMVFSIDGENSKQLAEFNDYLESYEQALESGLLKACKLIKEEKQ